MFSKFFNFQYKVIIYTSNYMWFSILNLLIMYFICFLTFLALVENYHVINLEITYKTYLFWCLKTSLFVSHLFLWFAMVILEKFGMLSMSLMSAKGRPYRCKLFCLRRSQRRRTKRTRRRDAIEKHYLCAIESFDHSDAAEKMMQHLNY